MFVAYHKTRQGHLIGIGLTAGDLERLRAGRPLSFALSDAGLGHSEDRVLVHFATPIELELAKSGSFPALTDAKIVLLVTPSQACQLEAGGAIAVTDSHPAIRSIVLFRGSEPRDAWRALDSLGLIPQPSGRASSFPDRPSASFRVPPLMGANAAGAIAIH